MFKTLNCSLETFHGVHKAGPAVEVHVLYVQLLLLQACASSGIVGVPGCPCQQMKASKSCFDPDRDIFDSLKLTVHVFHIDSLPMLLSLCYQALT